MAMKVALDPTIYTERAIAIAASAFADFADVVTLATSDGWDVEIGAHQPSDAPSVARHFLTYALAASLEERLL
jgi:hypothetical protein